MLFLMDVKSYKKKLLININFRKRLFKRRTYGEKIELEVYSAQQIYRDKSKKHVKMTPFLVGSNAPCVVVCPGGAYEWVSKVKEGIDFALALNERGYNAFVLSYSTAKHAKFPAPMNDLAACITYIKKNADMMNVDATNIHIMGASAGGHLCAYFGENHELFQTEDDEKTYSLKPNSIVLAYPVISMSEDFHRVSKLKLLGANPTAKEVHDKSMEFNVSENYPPTFFFHCKDDLSVPVSNSTRFDIALTDAKVEHKMKLFDKGGHGVGLGKNTDADGWIDEAVEFMDRFNR